jgi:hypothetical protein
MNHRLLMSSVCGAALIASAMPASADTPFTGVVQLSVGAGSTSGGGLLASAVEDPVNVDLKAKGLWNLGGELDVQVDLFHERASNLFDIDGKDSGANLGGTVHLIHSIENRARLGFAGSLWSNDTLFSSGDRSEARYGLAAVEGQFFDTNWTLSGQMGLFDQIGCDAPCAGTIEDGTYIQGKIRYFLNDNTSLSLATTQMWGSLNTNDPIFGGKALSDSTSHTLWRLEAEHRFANTPLSGLVAFSHERNETEFNNITLDTNTVWLGVRFYLDQTTLKANDRAGAEFETPTFGNSLESVGVTSAPPPTMVASPGSPPL